MPSKYETPTPIPAPKTRGEREGKRNSDIQLIPVLWKLRQNDH